MTERTRQWLKAHSLRLLALRDTPNAIAGGLAIGFFLGFTPLFGVKTLLAIGTAWLTRCNVLAAVIAVTLHDLALPFMPVLLRWEYQVGYWLLSDPHQWPPALRDIKLRPHELLSWTTFLSVGGPVLLGSLVIGLPVSVGAFVFARSAIIRHRLQHPPPPGETPPPASRPDV